MKKVNIGLKDKTHTQAKLIAVLKGMTMNEYFEKAIDESIERDKELIKKVSG
jgi:predicted HicB family RNase H-like nuclease